MFNTNIMINVYGKIMHWRKFHWMFNGILDFELIKKELTACKFMFYRNIMYLEIL